MGTTQRYRIGGKETQGKSKRKTQGKPKPKQKPKRKTKPKPQGKNKEMNREKGSGKGKGNQDDVDSGFTISKCSAGKSINDYTCYDSEALSKLKTLWNARHPDVKINTNDDKEIWEALKYNMSDVCDTEKCWIRQNFAKHKLSDDLLQYTFAPDSPKTWVKNPNEWLSSLDIEKVMKQYEKKHNNFVFMGPSPIDFDTHYKYGECVWEELCKFDLMEQIKNNKTNMGFIFNTDPHYSSGSHWISLFVDVNNNDIFFFDSTGERPPKQVKVLMNRIVSQGKKIGTTYKKIINDNVHQKSNTECGMYCLHMIISLLEKKHEPSYFLNHRISDKEMEDLRTEYFNKPSL